MNVEEVEATVRAAKELNEIAWAAPLLGRTRDIISRLSEGLVEHSAYKDNPLSDAEKSILIEIRFAYALHLSGASASYEQQVGIGKSSIDFVTCGNPSWMIEVMSLRESQAIKNASWENEPFFGMELSSDAKDPRQSEEGEVLKAQERICSKVVTPKHPD